jgi:hypothetical protein
VRSAQSESDGARASREAADGDRPGFKNSAQRERDLRQDKAGKKGKSSDQKVFGQFMSKEAKKRR